MTLGPTYFHFWLLPQYLIQNECVRDKIFIGQPSIKQSQNTNLEVFLHFVCLREGVLGGYCKRKNILVAVDEEVWGSCNCWVPNGESQRRDPWDSFKELRCDVIFSQVKHFWTIDRAILIDRHNNETIREWLNRQLRKQSRLRTSNPITFLNKLHWCDNFHCSFVNLCGNVEHLYKIREPLDALRCCVKDPENKSGFSS